MITLATLAVGSNTIDTRTYDDGGSLTASSYNNGVSESRAYNTLASISFTGAAIGDLTYGWDENKNKTSETIGGTMSGYGFSVGSSGCDDEDRLVNWQRSDTNLDQAWNLSAVGNWNSMTENTSTQNRTHGPTHELVSAWPPLPPGEVGPPGPGEGTVTHDAKGNMTLIPAVLRPGTDPLKMKWDFENKLIAADTDNDSMDDIFYKFDALGRRVGRDDGTANVVYFQDGQQTIADYPSGTAAGSPTYTYVYASYIDEPVMRGGSGGLRYYHRNQQYSITAVSDGGGSVVERYAYSAYGQVTIADASGAVISSSAIANRYTYTGREWDEGLSLYHYRARMYDPVGGRFVSRDPIGYEGSWWNLYEYVGSMPLDEVDPSGEVCAGCKVRNTEKVLQLPSGGTTSSDIGVQIKTTQPLTLGDCGAFSWGIQWKLKKPVGRTEIGEGGYIIQHIKRTIKAWNCDGSLIHERVVEYWEAWSIIRNRDITFYNVTGEPRDDLYSSGSWGTCTYGFDRIEGWYGFVKGRIPIDKLPKGGCRKEGAGDLYCSLTDPQVNVGHQRQHTLFVKWNCCDEPKN